MTIQMSVAVRNAELDAIETAIGPSPIIKLRTGGQPASCATADSGSVLATLNLPSDWLANASAGAKALAGNWEDASADGPGISGHFRIYDSGGSTCHMQGSVTITGGGGDLTLDNTNIATAQDVRVTSFTLTAGNA